MITPTKEITYCSKGELENIRARSISLGFPTPTNANLFQLGRSLWESASPRLATETKLWRQLKETRRRQAQWRNQERQKFTSNVQNPNGLDSTAIRYASRIYVDLKERKASYGDYVFNFAFPLDSSIPPPPVKLPRNLPNVIWKMAEYIEKPFPSGLPMARIDALRQSDNSIKIIEINPCWVDNLGTLQAFYETYQTTTQISPIDILCQQITSRRPLNRNIALLYGAQADGCKKDEIFGLAEYLKSSGEFNQVIVSTLNSNFDFNPYGTIYINGSFAMGQLYITETLAVEKIRKLSETKSTLLLPAQFTALDSKISLVGMSQTRPDLFLKTSLNRQDIDGPTIAKPLQSESLKGIITLPLGETPILPESYIYQPLVSNLTNTSLVCVNTKTKTIAQLPSLYEKINIWIIGNQITGVIATYDTSYMINDASYNLPLSWENI